MRRITLWLSWLLMFVVAFEDLAQEGALGTMGRIVGLGLAGCWLLSALALGRIRQPGTIHALMIGFTLWCATSILWSLRPEVSLDQSLTYIQLVLLAFIVWDLYETPEHLNSGLQAFLLGGWVCLVELFQAFLTGSVQRRFTVGFFNENTLGFTLALGIPIAWYLTLGGTRNAKRAGRGDALLRLSNLGFIPAATLGIALTASRASMASAMLGFGYMALSIGRLRRGTRVLLFVGAAACVVYGLRLVPEAAQGRLGSTSGAVSGDGDWNGRLPIWNEALRVISERPLLGTGVRAFTVANQTGKAAHNFALSIFAELGLVGFALFSGILLAAVASALRQPRDETAFWLTMLAVWALNASLQVLEDKKMTWLLFGLIAVSERLLRGAALGQRAQPPAAAMSPLGEAAPARR